MLAVVLDLASKQRHSKAAGCLAKCLKAEQPEQESIKAESQVALKIGNRLSLSGLITIGIGVLSWVISAIRGRKENKRLTPVIPLVLLAIYVMLYFISM